MPLSTETGYWNKIAATCVDGVGGITDNVWKRPRQMQMLLDYDWLGQRVLEVGAGNAVIAGALSVIVQKHWNYTGTDVSDVFAQSAKDMFGLNVVKADIRELPGKDYTRIIAFDSLEHVRPEHRQEGYAKIASVAEKGALLFLHFSYGESMHDKEFDHPFDTSDLVAIEKAGWTMLKYNRYVCKHPTGDIPYVFVVMKK